MQIKTKAMMYRMLLAGRFGNYQRAWYSLDDVMNSDYRGLVSLRSLQVTNPVRLYHVPHDELPARVASLSEATRQAGLLFCEAPPDHLRTIQGEYDGFNLTYSFVKLPMRLALDKDRRIASGPAARWLLHGHLGHDVEWLDELLHVYPGAVIEFSGFTAPVGMMQKRMLVWEVRHY